MKQTLISIGIMILLIIMSISDFDLGHFPDESQTVTDWDASQHDCLDYEIPERYMDGSDGSCVAANMVMRDVMVSYSLQCLYITNEGWIPSTVNPVTLYHIKNLLASDTPY